MTGLILYNPLSFTDTPVLKSLGLLRERAGPQERQ